MRCVVSLAVIRVAARHKSILMAPLCNSRKFEAAHEVPAAALRFTSCFRSVEVDPVRRIFVCERIRAAANYDVRVFGNHNFRNFLAVDDERRVRAGAKRAGRVNVLQVEFRNDDHHGWVSRVVVYERILAAACVLNRLAVFVNDEAFHFGYSPFVSVLVVLAVVPAASSGYCIGRSVN